MTDERPEPSTTGDERSLLVGFLDWHRATLALKCAGLSDEQLRQHAVPTSNVTLLGLLRHLAGAERGWFRMVIAGEDLEPLHNTTDEEDEDFDNLDADTGADALAVWEAEGAACRDAIADLPLDAVGTNPFNGKRYSLRWVLIHLIEEYARHNGHADLIREAIDGSVGE